MRLIHVLHQLPVQACVTFRHEQAGLPSVNEALEAGAAPCVLTPPRSPGGASSETPALKEHGKPVINTQALPGHMQQQQQPVLLSPRSCLQSFSSPGGRSRSRSTSVSSASVSTAGLTEQLNAVSQAVGSPSQQAKQLARSPSANAASGMSASNVVAEFSFTARFGHAALFSGLAALEQGHEAVYIGSLGKLSVVVDNGYSSPTYGLQSPSGSQDDQEKMENVGGVMLTVIQKEDPAATAVDKLPLHPRADQRGD